MEVRTEDKMCILQLERELNNCCQEIDYLQDQLNGRNAEVYSLQDHICSLELRLLDMKILEDEVTRLREELKIYESERSLLMQELENKHLELNNGMQCIEKLEESISSIGLDYQCEIESMKLDLLEAEQNFLNTKKSLEEANEENVRMKHIIQELENQVKDKEQIGKCLEEKNKDLKNACSLELGREEQVQRRLADEDPSSSAEEVSSKCRAGDFSAANGAEWITQRASDTDSKEKMTMMSQEIQEYQLLVEKLKEELKAERLKAKEEAEDLAQEMAELRYQLTGMLEAEYQRRAIVERKSLQRINELEAELEKEKCKSFNHQEQMRSATALRHIQAT